MASCSICQRWCRMGASSMSALRCHLKGKCFLYWEEGRDKEPGQAAGCAKWKEELIPFLRPDLNIWVLSLGVSHPHMFFCVCVCVFFFSALTDQKRLREIKTHLMSNRWLIQVIECNGGCESKAWSESHFSTRYRGTRWGCGWHLKVSSSQVIGMLPAAGDLCDCSLISHIRIIRKPGCTFMKLFEEEWGVITTKLKGVIFTLLPTWGPVVEYSITCQSQHIRQSSSLPALPFPAPS